MALILGTFLLKALCTIIPCYPIYQTPTPVPLGLPPPIITHSISENTFSENPSIVSHPTPKAVVHRHTKPVGSSLFTGSQKPYSYSYIPSKAASSSSKVLKVKIPILKSPYVVSTPSGAMQGFPMKTFKSRNIIAFTGIPYAEPPINNLQYKDPVPKKPWPGIYQATKIPPDCLQVDGMQQYKIVGSVDCLYLNVYTPFLPSADQMKNLNVIVFIHGGSFAFGSGSNYGPGYLLDKDIVLVTFNYRLSSFGFLSTGNAIASGNWGLKDQLLVLKWVKANIALFSGDPNNVLLVGQDAGAVSVHLHMMSKQSRGLFNAGISQSANAFCYWAVRQDSIKFTFKLAKSLGCPTNDSVALVQCMRQQNPNNIVQHEAALPDYKIFPGVFFGPNVEMEGPSAFLTSSPDMLYKKGNVLQIPWINGFLAGEGNGIAFLTWLYPFVMQEVDARWTALGPKILDIKGEEKFTSKAAETIKMFYFGNNKRINFKNRKQLAQMVGDRLVTSAVYKGLRHHSQVAPTYGYFFNFTGKYGTSSIYGLKSDDWGISHDDDLIYLFNSTVYQPLKLDEPEYKFSEFLINIWTNLAKFGKPVFSSSNGTKISFWKPVTISNDTKEIQVVSFQRGVIPKMIEIPFMKRIKFWQNLELVSNSLIQDFPNVDSLATGSSVERILITSHYEEENGNAKLRVSYNSKNISDYYLQ